MTFAEAMRVLCEGKPVRRTSWNSDREIWIQMHRPSEAESRYITQHRPNNNGRKAVLVFWRPEQADILADDWEEAE